MTEYQSFYSKFQAMTIDELASFASAPIEKSKRKNKMTLALRSLAREVMRSRVNAVMHDGI